tara:strand:+ start:2121 stop:2369 length:249 start_codon:yes stop_codon:yes gene_type:complete
MHNLPDMDDVVFQLDIDSISADQKIKMLQMGLQYQFQILKHESNEKEVLDRPLFIDIVTRDKENGGWNSNIRSFGTFPIKDH